jgi:hypothetical protein
MMIERTNKDDDKLIRKKDEGDKDRKGIKERKNEVRGSDLMR